MARYFVNYELALAGEESPLGVRNQEPPHSGHDLLHQRLEEPTDRIENSEYRFDEVGCRLWTRVQIEDTECEQQG